jgi:hypothetical protein
MRAVASRRVLFMLPVLLVAIALLSGCSSELKRNYLRHLEVTIAPTSSAETDLAIARPDVQP